LLHPVKFAYYFDLIHTVVLVVVVVVVMMMIMMMIIIIIIIKTPSITTNDVYYIYGKFSYHMFRPRLAIVR
jgi:hypothetical protein